MAHSTPSLHLQLSHLLAAAPKEYHFLSHSRARLLIGTAIWCTAWPWTRTVPAGVSSMVYRVQFYRAYAKVCAYAKESRSSE